MSRSATFDRPISAELKGVVFVTAVVTLFFFVLPGPIDGRRRSRGFGALCPMSRSEPGCLAGYRLVCYDFDRQHQ